MHFITLSGKILNSGEIDHATTFDDLRCIFATKQFEKVRFILENGTEIDNYTFPVLEWFDEKKGNVTVIFDDQDIKKRLPYAKDTDHHEIIAYLERPEHYGWIPSISQTMLPENMKPVIHASQVHYLNTCCTSNSLFKLKSINGVDLSFPRDQHECDLCYARVVKYMRCNDCHQDVCTTCSFDTSCSEEGHDVEKRTFCKQTLEECTTCQSVILDKTYYFVSASNMCQTCYEQTSSEEKTNATVKQTFCESENCSFGSLLDWVPIIEEVTSSEGEEFERIILFNANINSIYYTRIGACVADERYESHYVMFSSSCTIESLLARLMELEDQGVTSIIERYMEEEGMPVVCDND